jgi:hypothetical protein
MTAPPSAGDLERGARNLLLSCAKARAGEHVLIVGEDGPDPYFDPAVCETVARTARDLGFEATVMLARPVGGAAEFPTSVRAAMRAADHTIFFSRLGGQARFALEPDDGHAVNAYAQTLAHLGDPFCTVDHGNLARVHTLLVERIAACERYVIEAPCGTALSGRIPRGRAAAMTDFALDLFPLMIFPPVTTKDLAGVLVIDHFVTSTATRSYEDSVLRLDRPLHATIRESRIVTLDGPEDLANRLRAQMERATELTAGDPMRINSWHTGINPNTFFDGDPYADLDKWGAVAFGSPRYTHFHAAGEDPGDVAFSLMDATIRFDGEAFWEAGRFVFLDRPDVQALVDPEDRAALHSGVCRSIGL